MSRVDRGHNAPGPERVGKKFSQGQKGRCISPLDRLSVVQHLNRKWARYLNANEFRVMVYILDRSVFWGQPTFRASHKNILKGTAEYAGIGMPERTYKRTLTTLENRGAIIRKRSRDCVILGLNFNWKPEEEAVNLPVPKRLKKAKCGEKCHTGISEVPQWHTEEREYKKGSSYSDPSARGSSASDDFGKKSEEEKTESTSPDFEKNQKAIGAQPPVADQCNGLQRGNEAAQRVKTLLSSRQEELSDAEADRIAVAMAKTTPNSTDFKLIWNKALRETYPDALATDFTVVLKRRINLAIKRYGRNNPVSFLELTDWAVRNWAVIMRTHFHWIKKDRPELPTVHWFISEGVFMKFAEAYMSGSLHKLKNSRETDELTRLLANGMPEQEALALIGEKRAARKMRQQMEKTKREAQQKLAAARAREEAARRFEGIADKLADAGVPVQKIPPRRPGQVWTGMPIPHPDSPAMQEQRRKEREAAGKKALEETQQANTTAPGMRSPVPTETWEELQERLRRERSGMPTNR